MYRKYIPDLFASVKPDEIIQPSWVRYLAHGWESADNDIVTFRKYIAGNYDFDFAINQFKKNNNMPYSVQIPQYEFDHWLYCLGYMVDYSPKYRESFDIIKKNQREGRHIVKLRTLASGKKVYTCSVCSHKLPSRDVETCHVCGTKLYYVDGYYELYAKR